MTPTDDNDRLAKDFIIERFETSMLSHDAGEWQRTLRAIAAPTTTLRSTFDLMSRDGEEAWRNIAARLHAIPGALTGLRATYDGGRADGIVAARRQALVAADQCATWAANRWFDTPGRRGRSARRRLGHVARRHRRGRRRRRTLRTATLPTTSATTTHPTQTKSTGAARALQRSVCARCWAPTSIRRRCTSGRGPTSTTCAPRSRQPVQRIKPGASFTEVIDLLDNDPDRAEHSADAYQSWLQALTDEALSRSKEHFEIPAVMDRCEALIPPEGSAAAAYYTGPSEDFTRPGRTWYPTLGRTMFPRWGDVTTCYHESVPGHHLQIAYAKVQAASLSRIQRSSFIPGHGEGWALYAEQLCDEFGWFENPDYRLGFLGGQILRTVRVIIDIGMHLGKTHSRWHHAQRRHALPRWRGLDPDLAFEFSVHETGHTEAFMRSEIDRYLGWPAQAISYKIGQREWVAARDDARARDGDAFDMKAWHTKALRLGAIGLDQLRAELAR